jgi:hypothetical protein
MSSHVHRLVVVLCLLVDVVPSSAVRDEVATLWWRLDYLPHPPRIRDDSWSFDGSSRADRDAGACRPTRESIIAAKLIALDDAYGSAHVAREARDLFSRH